MAQRIDVDREMVKQLFLQGLKYSAIAERTGVNQKTVRTWSSRYGWTQIATQAKQSVVKACKDAVLTGLQARGDAIRLKLVEEVECQVDILMKTKPRYVSDLRNDNGLQGRSALAKSIIDSATVLFGWEDQKQPGLILVGELRRFDEGKVVDVESSLVVSGPTESPVV